MTKYIIGILILTSLLFGFLSYSFYGSYKEALQKIGELSSSLEICQKNEQKAKDNTKNISEGMSSVLIENERINKDFKSLQDELRKKRSCTNVYQSKESNSSSSDDQYVSDVVRLLKQGADSARAGISNNTKSSD